MGYVYVLSNPAMPGLVKIGYTDGLVHDRARELSSATGVPAPFFVEFTKQTEIASEMESVIHRALSDRRVSPNREFFRLAAAEAIQEIYRIYEGMTKRDEAAAQILLRALSDDKLAELLQQLSIGTGSRIANAVRIAQSDSVDRTRAGGL